MSMIIQNLVNDWAAFIFKGAYTRDVTVLIHMYLFALYGAKRSKRALMKERLAKNAETNAKDRIKHGFYYALM